MAQNISESARPLSHAETASTARPERSKLGRKLVPILLIVVLAAAAFGIWRSFFSTPPVPNSIVALSGRIEGDDSAIAPKTAGRILDVRVREGDTVKAGDIIAVLDD